MMCCVWTRQAGQARAEHSQAAGQGPGPEMRMWSLEDRLPSLWFAAQTQHRYEQEKNKADCLSKVWAHHAVFSIKKEKKPSWKDPRSSTGSEQILFKHVGKGPFILWKGFVDIRTLAVFTCKDFCRSDWIHSDYRLILTLLNNLMENLCLQAHYK